MPQSLTSLVGKPSLNGGSEVLPRSGRVIANAAKAWARRNHQVKIQVRPGLVNGSALIAGDIKATIETYLDQIRDDKKVRVVVARSLSRGPHERSGRMRSEVVEYPVDQPFQVGVEAALLILNRLPYSLVFEEVIEGSDLDPAPLPSSALSPQQAQAFSRLEAEMMERLERIKRLEAQMEARVNAAPKPAKKAPPKPKGKK